ncbi:MAG: hypothetical protein ACN6PR_05070 [Achromobacter sp.]
MSQDSLKKLEGETIVSSRYGHSDFASFITGKAAFAMLGAAAMMSAGNNIVKEDAFENLTFAISAGLQRKLASLKNYTAVNEPEASDKDDVATVVTTNRDGFFLDVKTLTGKFNCPLPRIGRISGSAIR